MIAVDTNILIYAHQRQSTFYAPAFASMQTLAEGGKPWGIPAACLSEFLANVTHPQVLPHPSTFEQALAQVDAWLESPTAHILHSGLQHWKVLSDLTRRAKLQGGQFHDARIAAICIENGVSLLWTADRDFAKFKVLKTTNPLV
ncbi:MAG: PIN domain-containing protein [Cytophagales bacterium]|nr:PIN domain-containing protein [Cytophagales bacterium]